MNTNKNFDNPFDGLDKYGRDKVQIYIFLHIQAMLLKEPNMPFLTALRLATQALYNAMFLNISDKTSDTKQRMVQTEAVKNSLDKLFELSILL